MSKVTEFSITGETIQLEDGKTRPFTLVAIRTVDTTIEPVSTMNIKIEGTRHTKTIVYDQVEKKTYTVAFGLALVSPLDAPKATPQQGLAIARGKASKEKSAYLILSSTSGYFTEARINQILKEESAKITLNPYRFVKLSRETTKAKPSA